MELPSAKELKKLADACRKAGIISFKGGGIEFTLSDEAPISSHKRAKAAKVAFVEQGDIETDSPSPEELLMWSVGGGVSLDPNETKAAE